ncbi:MAG: LLM class flavin-dependent oxidoreductase [Alphaproteobacteria bacterium]|jgi:probable F420-dependent oxidoreductase|nr:LLM class flavin-dependent oxidoreductase [Alphaproteobacteria bacterium]MDP6812995.1 LLM class flavin-dependent oxidoreductase [Alphaproteobacteria bacterium]
MTLRLDERMRFGIQTMHRRTEPAEGPWLPEAEDGRALVEMIDGLGYDSLWLGDHLSFAIPILDPLIQLAQAAAYSDRLLLGVGVYLLPLRHPGPVAKQVATLDHLSGGRLIFGVGVGGEFKTDYAVAGVPLAERGARLSEAIAVLRKLWSGKPVAHEGRFFGFSELTMSPPARQSGGPPIWCGGRSEAALRRAGVMADGWISYVVTPEMFQQSLDRIRGEAEAAGREAGPFGTGHLLFACVDDSYETALDKATETLSVRYAMDFREAARKYCALGRPEDVAERLVEFHGAGVRHVVMDFVGPYEERDRQFERFAREVLPLMADYR